MTLQLFPFIALMAFKELPPVEIKSSIIKTLELRIKSP